MRRVEQGDAEANPTGPGKAAGTDGIFGRFFESAKTYRVHLDAFGYIMIDLEII